MTSEYTARSIEEFITVAEHIVKLMDEYRIFILKGNLGAGKTTLVQQICTLLKTEDVVTSPTFALINPYLTEKAKVFHMDMYRVNSPEEAIEFGIEEYLWDEDNFCFIEWPDSIEILLPEKYVEIKIRQMPDQSRELSLTTFDDNN